MTTGKNSVIEILVVRHSKQTFSGEFHVFTPVRLRISPFWDKILRHCVIGFGVSRDRSLDPCR